MASRTQIVCLHEGEKGRSIDPVFINTLVKTLRRSWIRPWDGSNVIRPVSCGGRSSLVVQMPDELRKCIAAGSDVTLMVWADLDHDMNDGDQLKGVFWAKAQAEGITKAQFDAVVFIFAKDRLENWIEFLAIGVTDESREGPRLKYDRQAADAARSLASMCKGQATHGSLPPSLAWSCRNWRELAGRMQR